MPYIAKNTVLFAIYEKIYTWTCNKACNCTKRSGGGEGGREREKKEREIILFSQMS